VERQELGAWVPYPESMRDLSPRIPHLKRTDAARPRPTWVDWLAVAAAVTAVLFLLVVLAHLPPHLVNPNGN
jgi:hypothetical protein